MILLLITLYPRNNSSGPLNDQILQSIPLIKISVHELFHCLTWKAVFLAFLVEFGLLAVDVIDEVAELAQRECPIVRMSDR